MGTEASQTERWRTGSHMCQSSGGGHRGPERLHGSSDGWQGWLEKEPWGGGGGGSIEVDLVVVVVIAAAAAAAAAV